MTEKTVSPSWGEFIQQQAHAPMLVRAILETALSALDKYEADPTPLTEFSLDAVLGEVVRSIAPMQRELSIDSARRSAVALSNPEIRKKVAAKQEAKAEKIKRQKAAYKGHATRKRNGEAEAAAEAKVKLSTDLAIAGDTADNTPWGDDDE